VGEEAARMTAIVAIAGELRFQSVLRAARLKFLEKLEASRVLAQAAKQVDSARRRLRFTVSSCTPYYA
jgi:hypothetical protein